METYNLEEMLFGLVCCLLVACVVKAVYKRMPKPQFEPLDVPFMSWSNEDPFTVRDLLNGGAIIFGRSGSGKTSGSGKFILKSIIQHPRSAGLLLCAKPEDCDDYRKLFERAGRLGDLLVVHPDGELRCNFLDYTRKLGGDARELTKTVSTIGECLRAGDTKGGGEDGDMWEQQAQRMIYNAIELLRLAYGKVTAPELQRFIAGCATDPKQVGSDEWKGKYHCQTIKKAFDKQKSPIEKHDYELAEAYWTKEIPQLAARTRTSIQVGVMQLMHVFNTGIVREMVSTDTNASPDDILQGKWVCVNMPPSKYGDSGNFVNAGWKYLTQKAVLRRKAEKLDPFVVIWCDEAQQFVNSHDSHYLAQCRSHLGCEVFLTQSLHSLFGNMSGARGREQAQALLTNFSSKIFHALGSAQDAEYASSLLGKEIQVLTGGSVAPAEDWLQELVGNPQMTTNFSEHYEAIVQPKEFINGLRTGGKSNGFCVDAIVVRSGDSFRDGRNWKRVTFNQKG